jgi:hypothetical protein
MTNLTYIMPCFIIADLTISVSFYVDKLGFQIRYIGPDENPYWAIVGRDNISIMLKAVAPEIKPIPNRTGHEWAPSDAYISTAAHDFEITISSIPNIVKAMSLYLRAAID